MTAETRSETSVAARLVAHIMSRPVLTVETSETLWDAWQLLFVSGLRHLVVIDSSGTAVGVLSDRNVLAEVPVTAEHLNSLRVSDVLSRVPTAFISPDHTAHEAAQVMTRHSLEALPVVGSDGRLAGIVTESDLVHWMGAAESS